MRLLGYIALMLCIPFYVSAEVLITEIMYAPDGADSKHEWIEVCSDSTQDIAGWKFYENDTNHGLSLISGTSSLGSGECAIIADDSDTFLTDHPSFSGNLFDSAFSLSNTGETISLKDDSSTIVDSVTYSESDGAKDDGNSLHRSGSTLTSKTPTPGSNVSTPTTSNVVPIVTTTILKYESVVIEPPQDIYLRVPETISTTVKSFTKFKVESYTSTGKTNESGYITWSFGDGGQSTGREVIHQYYYPGEYSVVVEIKIGSLFDTKKIMVKVTALEASLLFSKEGKWVSIENKSSFPLDLSNWRILSSGQYFKIPDGTIVNSNKLVKFPREITKLSSILVAKSVSLVYPDGTQALVGVIEKEEIKEEEIYVEVVKVPVKVFEITPISIKEVIKEPLVEDENKYYQPAVVVLSSTNDNNSYLNWILSLGGLLLISILFIYKIGKLPVTESRE